MSPQPVAGLMKRLYKLIQGTFRLKENIFNPGKPPDHFHPDNAAGNNRAIAQYSKNNNLTGSMDYKTRSQGLKNESYP